MKNDYLLPTAVACRVARIERQKFNEQVAAGNCGFAPETRPGVSRYFDEDATIALYIFARLTDPFRAEGGKQAGFVATQVWEELRRLPDDSDERQIAVCYSVNGSVFIKKGSDLPAPDQTMNPAPFEIRIFDLDNIRGELANSVAYERRIVGGHEAE